MTEDRTNFPPGWLSAEHYPRTAWAMVDRWRAEGAAKERERLAKIVKRLMCRPVCRFLLRAMEPNK